MSRPLVDKELYLPISRYFGVIDMMFTGSQREDFLHCPPEEFPQYHQTQRKKIVKRILNYDPYLLFEAKRRRWDPIKMADYMLMLYQLQTTICRARKLELWADLEHIIERETEQGAKL